MPQLTPQNSLAWVHCVPSRPCPVWLSRLLQSAKRFFYPRWWARAGGLDVPAPMRKRAPHVSGPLPPHLDFNRTHDWNLQGEPSSAPGGERLRCEVPLWRRTEPESMGNLVTLLMPKPHSVFWRVDSGRRSSPIPNHDGQRGATRTLISR